MINKIPLTTKMLNALRNWGIRQISWIIPNIFSNSIGKTLPVNINNPYQIVIKYSLLKLGFPKISVLLILLFL